MNPPVKKGERLVVYGRPERAVVADCVYVPAEARWAIVLDWGVYGISRVYDNDEGKVWFRYAAAS